MEKFKISPKEPTACQTNKCGTEMISYKCSIHTTNLSMANSYFQKSQFCNYSMMPLSWYNSDISTYLEFWEKALVTGKCVFALMCICCLSVYHCFYFRCRTAGYKSVFGRSCDWPSRHRFFLVSLCL